MNVEMSVATYFTLSIVTVASFIRHAPFFAALEPITSALTTVEGQGNDLITHYLSELYGCGRDYADDVRDAFFDVCHIVLDKMKIACESRDIDAFRLASDFLCAINWASRDHSMLSSSGIFEILEKSVSEFAPHELVLEDCLWGPLLIHDALACGVINEPDAIGHINAKGAPSFILGLVHTIMNSDRARIAACTDVTDDAIAGSVESSVSFVADVDSIGLAKKTFMRSSWVSIDTVIDEFRLSFGVPPVDLDTDNFDAYLPLHGDYKHDASEFQCAFSPSSFKSNSEGATVIEIEHMVKKTTNSRLSVDGCIVETYVGRLEKLPPSDTDAVSWEFVGARVKIQSMESLDFLVCFNSEITCTLHLKFSQANGELLKTYHAHPEQSTKTTCV